MLVAAVAKSQEHKFSKQTCANIHLIEGLGVEGDCHFGVTVQHLSRVAVDPTQPNLRQVHLIQSELFDELALDGCIIKPADLGENITTRGIDILGLPTSSLLKIGANAVIEITGLRNPCHQIDGFRQGLLSKVVFKDQSDGIVRKSGVMGIIRKSGIVSAGDSIMIELPWLPHRPLQRV